MVERSSSHKSDGRQSSAGQSIHSVRTNSLGLETGNLLGRGRDPPDVPPGPPPGLFILGPVPSIIRCWLNTNFSNETLLYAAVCTGSYKSFLSSATVSRLGLSDQKTRDENGTENVKISVYLPEATVQQAVSSRSSSPAPQLPALTVSFTVEDSQRYGNSIQIVLGSDVLRAHNADILFSQSRLTLFDDTQNKLSIPLVRPEDATVYKSLVTFAHNPETGLPPRNGTEKQERQPFVDPTGEVQSAKSIEINGVSNNAPSSNNTIQQNLAPSTSASFEAPVSSESLNPTASKITAEGPLSLTRDEKIELSNGPENTPTQSRTEAGSIWGSWRRDSTPSSRTDVASSSNSTTGSGYQRAGRGRGMKVLKPAKSGTTTSSRSFSATQPLTGFDSAPPRFVENGRKGSHSGRSDDRDDQPSEPGGSFSSETRGLAVSKEQAALGVKSRSANPIGGATAFGWLNSGQQKRSTTAGD